MFYYSDKVANENYYRECVDFLYKRLSFFPAYISVKNTGNLNAENVRVEIAINNIDVSDIFEECELPDNDDGLPKRIKSRIEIPSTSIKNLKFRRNNNDGTLEISQDSNSYHIEVEYRHIQSGRTIYLDPFFISKNQTGKIVVNGTVFSQLKPQNFSLYLDCIIDAHKLTIEMIDEINKKK
jgi:hypothetical protein